MPVQRTGMPLLRALSRPLRNAGITTKIVAVVLVTCSVFALAGAIALVGIRSMAKASDSLYRDEVSTLAAAANLRAGVSASHDAVIFERRVVGSIQEGSRNAVEAMNDVATVIQEVNENQATIAAAVEEQNATARLIGSNAAMAANGSSEIARNIESVAAAARDATHGAAQTEGAANELAEMASRLRTLLAGFRV